MKRRGLCGVEKTDYETKTGADFFKKIDPRGGGGEGRG